MLTFRSLVAMAESETLIEAMKEAGGWGGGGDGGANSPQRTTKFAAPPPLLHETPSALKLNSAAFPVQSVDPAKK
jgi:hypothetical protein